MTTGFSNKTTQSPSPSRKADAIASASRPRAESSATEAIDDDEQFARLREVVGAANEVVEMQYPPVGLNPHESLRAEVLDDDVVRHFLRRTQAETRREASAFGNAITASVTDWTVSGWSSRSQTRTIGASDARPEQAQVVVDLGRGPDGGSRGLGRVLLLDRDRRRQAVDQVDVGLLHSLEELPRVRGERLDVPALPLGVDRVERERGLAGAGRPGDDGERPARDLEVEVFEVVLSCSADDDVVLHPWKANADVAAPMARRNRAACCARGKQSRTLRCGRNAEAFTPRQRRGKSCRREAPAIRE